MKLHQLESHRLPDQRQQLLRATRHTPLSPRLSPLTFPPRIASRGDFCGASHAASAPLMAKRPVLTCRPNAQNRPDASTQHRPA